MPPAQGRERLLRRVVLLDPLERRERGQCEQRLLERQRRNLPLEPGMPDQRRPLEPLVLLRRHQEQEGERVTEAELAGVRGDDLGHRLRVEEVAALDRPLELGARIPLLRHERMFAEFAPKFSD